MAIYQNVLVAIDMGGGASDVLKKAEMLLAGSDANITVLYVIYNSPTMYDGYMGVDIYGASLGLDEAELRKGALPKIEDLVRKFRLPNLQVKVDFGRATDVILEHANKQKADLIVLGSHGRHGLRLLLGSTANGVLHRAECDVLAVRIADETQ
jgi:universal stress protein A